MEDMSLAQTCFLSKRERQAPFQDAATRSSEGQVRLLGNNLQHRSVLRLLVLTVLQFYRVGGLGRDTNGCPGRSSRRLA